jgi:transcriptional regulator with XRE-family HTH domain
MPERDTFKLIREGQRKTQIQLAVEVGLSAGTVSAFESGKEFQPTMRVRQLLATAYGVSIEEIEAACGKPESAATTPAA